MFEYDVPTFIVSLHIMYIEHIYIVYLQNIIHQRLYQHQ